MKTIPLLTHRQFRNLGDATSNTVVAGAVSPASSQGTLSQNACSMLAASNPTVQTQQLSGFVVPSSAPATVAGINALLTQLQAEYVAGTISKAQMDDVLDALYVPPPPAEMVNQAAAEAAYQAAPIPAQGSGDYDTNPADSGTSPG